jgi:hypothetical protein
LPAGKKILIVVKHSSSFYIDPAFKYTLTVTFRFALEKHLVHRANPTNAAFTTTPLFLVSFVVERSVFRMKKKKNYLKTQFATC